MRKRVILAAVVALALVPVASGAYAASGKKAGKRPAAHLLRRHAVMKASASYLGIDVKQLRAQLKSGKSLDQVADATAGKSSSGLLSDLIGIAQAKLDKLVAAGKLKAARETKVLDRVTKRLQKRLARVR